MGVKPPPVQAEECDAAAAAITPGAASMPRLAAYGPSLLVLVTASLVLFLGPNVIRQITFAQAEAEAVQASHRLEHGTLLEQMNQAYRDIAAAVEPSVVHIAAEQYFRVPGERVEVRNSSGSGWVYDEQGHIVTNAHVIEDAQQIDVQMQDGMVRRAELVGRDQQTDIAVIKIEPVRLMPAQLGTSDDVRQGDQVFAFGSPFDFRFSVSSGIVSGTGRSAGGLADITYQDFIQVDAAINPGNSGGPLTDVHGRVIGMNTAIATDAGNRTGGGQSAGIGLAIPMSMIRPVVEQLISTGEVSKGWMGVVLNFESDTAIAAARRHGFDGQGVVISSIEPGSPAERAGLLPGDIITTVDNRPVDNRAQIRSSVSSKRPGDMVRLQVWRLNKLAVDGPGGGGDAAATGGTTFAVEVVLAVMDATIYAEATVELVKRLGLHDLSTSTMARARQLGIPHHRGVIIERISDDSPYASRLRRGAVILAVEGRHVANVSEFYRLLHEALFESVPARLGTANPRVQVSVVNPDGNEHLVTFSHSPRMR
jgi:serine protease Do